MPNEDVKPAASSALGLTVLPAPLAICRLDPLAATPAWAWEAREFLTISRTPTELSIVADEAAVPPELAAERGYRALRVDGPLPLGMVGIFARLAVPLAGAGVPIFPIATFDTDYLLVRENTLSQAIAALARAGHRVTVGASVLHPDLAS